MEPKLLSKNWTKLSHEILEDARIPGKYRLQISALYGIIYNGSKAYGYCSFTQEYLAEKIFVERRHIAKLLEIMDELCYIHIESKIFDNRGSHKTQTRIKILDKKIVRKNKERVKKAPNLKENSKTKDQDNKETTYVARTENVRSTYEGEDVARTYKYTNTKKNNKDSIENSFLNSVEENSKTKKQYPNSIRQKAIELDPKIIVNEYGQTTSPVFGKGFNKYAEDLYDI